jgi:transketolase
MGDGELNEGTIWEGAMSAAKFECDHLIGIVDWNKVQLDGMAEDVMPMHHMEERWRSFGWNVFRCDGHDIEALYKTICKAKQMRNGKPCVVLADTVKGKGVSFMEGTNKYHGKAITDEEFANAMKEL